MDLPGKIFEGALARAALVLLRLQSGVVFLVAGLPKVRQDFTPKLIDFLQGVTLERGHPFYQAFVRAAVLPHVQAFAPVIAWGEVLVGCALLLGLFTRFAAAAAVLLSVNYMLAKGAWPWTPSSNDAAYVAISLALLVGAAGRTLGFDALLAGRWPRSPLW